VFELPGPDGVRQRDPRYGSEAYAPDCRGRHRPDKNLAKLANHAAKKWQRQTGGVVDLSNIDRQRRLLALVPVEDVWGVGGASVRS
jgi:nucleotidyltransferase/DNA polymerase involved in DNA repair